MQKLIMIGIICCGFLAVHLLQLNSATCVNLEYRQMTYPFAKLQTDLDALSGEALKEKIFTEIKNNNWSPREIIALARLLEPQEVQNLINMIQKQSDEDFARRGFRPPSRSFPANVKILFLTESLNKPS